ncbi:hypothetical protein ACLFLG_00860 [Acinetobacter pittii]|uniref:hypothetical protein n=1 Tax=Acinetobacter pittii TaxID=48296 RepID=UPI003978C256
MNKLFLISKVGGYANAERILMALKKEGRDVSYTVTLDCGFTFHASELYEAWSNPKFDYNNGIIIGSFNRNQKLILSNAHDYLGCYWGYHSFRPTVHLKSVQNLNDLKSEAINNGAKIDWNTYQWVLNNFELISP